MQKLTGRSYWILLIILISFAFFCKKQNEQAALQQALDLADPGLQITALQNFVKDFPESKNIKRAYQNIFRNEVKMGSAAAAVKAAAQYLALIPENARMQDYNSMAWTLAENDLALDSARVYAERAVQLGRETNYRHLGMILDTYAYTLFKTGDAVSAEKFQEEAMPGNEDDSGFLSRLAEYQHANNKSTVALNTMARAILLGAEMPALQKFNDWLGEARPQTGARQALAKEIVEQTVAGFLKQNDTPMGRSQAAMLLVRTGINLDRAEKWAGEAIRALDKNASPDEQILLNKNLALVYKTRNDYVKMIEILEPWQQVAMPYDQDYWFTLGLAYQQTGQKEKTLRAVMNGLALDSNEELFTLAKNSGYSEAEINSAVQKYKQELIAFNPGHWQAGSATSGRVVLTELFTGAECGPCVGADKALDLLAEYYPRQTMVLLEYHLHIPGPDPLSNTSAEARYEFYGKNFGTPTVFLNGLIQYGGGGPELVKKSLFFRYSQVIEQYDTLLSRIALGLSAGQQNQLVQVKVEVSSSDHAEKAPLNLYLALVEKSVNYTGANGITRHAFVVRYMVNQGTGIPVIFKDGKSTIDQTINLQNVNDSLIKYLDDFAKNPPERYKNFPGWNVRPDHPDPLNLAVVAWIQGADSKEIFQAGYQELNKQ
jgi:hypothetical protein